MATTRHCMAQNIPKILLRQLDSAGENVGAPDLLLAGLVNYFPAESGRERGNGRKRDVKKAG